MKDESSQNRLLVPILNIVVGFLIPVSYAAAFYLLSHSDADFEFIRFLGMAGYAAVWIAMILYALYAFRRFKLAPLFTRIRPKRLVLEVVLCFFLALAIGAVGYIGVRCLSSLLGEEPPLPGIYRFADYSPGSYVMALFLVLGFTLFPLVEELYYRGYLQNALKTRVPLLPAILLQGLVFSLSHLYGLIYSVYLLIAGLALGAIYQWRKNLLSPVLVHVSANALVLVPLIVLMFQNAHNPALDWEEAASKPAWLNSESFARIEKQASGEEQWQYAIDTWGSKGARRWKIEIAAFEAVCRWFPEDREPCAKARLGIITIYSDYLKDYRRAVLEAEKLESNYPDQREQLARAVCQKGWAYYRLGDFEKSRKAFEKVIEGFSEFEDAVIYSQQGLEWLSTER